MYQITACLRLVFGLTVSAAIGCSPAETQPQSVAAEGMVTYNGKPLEGAQVSFLSTDARRGRSASAVTDEAGKFQLQTFVIPGRQVAGAVPGSYKVAIRKREPPQPASGSETNATTGSSAPSASSETPSPSSADKSESSDTDAPASSNGETPKGPAAAPSARSPNASMGGPGAGGMPAKPPDVKEGKSLIPEKYGNPDESGLTAVVKAEGNEPFQFDLTDE